MYGLRMLARQQASMDAREGADKMRSLGRRMKAVSGPLEALRRRLRAAQRKQLVGDGAREDKPANKGTSSKTSSEEEEDLLSELDSL